MAGELGGMNVSRLTKTSRSAEPITISGVTSVESASRFAGRATRPRQRVIPIASATPSGTAIAIASPARRRLWNSAERRSGSCQTDRSGSPQYQRVDQPWPELRERPSLNEKRTASSTGTSDHAR